MRVAGLALEEAVVLDEVGEVEELAAAAWARDAHPPRPFLVGLVVAERDLARAVLGDDVEDLALRAQLAVRVAAGGAHVAVDAGREPVLRAGDVLRADAVRMADAAPAARAAAV